MNRKNKNKDNSAGSAKTTMADIAAELGVSKNAVSLALGGRIGVSDGLRERVVNKAKEMNYDAAAAARGTKLGCIVVLVPEYFQSDTVNFSEIIWSIESEAKTLGYVVIHEGVTKTMEKSLTLPALRNDILILGIILVGVFADVYVEKLFKLGYPMLTVEVTCQTVPVGCVGAANFSGGHMAARYLIYNGHRNIGFIGPAYTAMNIYERWCGFKLAIRQAGLRINKDYMVLGEDRESRFLNSEFKFFYNEPGSLSIEAELEFYVKGWFPGPTAWFCADDRIAATLISILAKRGVSVPEQVSIMGFGDAALAETILPPLTTVRVDRKKIGQLAVERLCEIMSTGNRQAVIINVTGELVVRKSVLRLR